jgi:hypothetical protein
MHAEFNMYKGYLILLAAVVVTFSPHCHGIRHMKVRPELSVRTFKPSTPLPPHPSDTSAGSITGTEELVLKPRKVLSGIDLSSPHGVVVCFVVLSFCVLCKQKSDTLLLLYPGA